MSEAASRFLAVDAAEILTPVERFTPGRLLVRGGAVERVGKTFDVPLPENSDRLDASNLTLVPGFIDPHIHGIGGADVMDATAAAMSTMCRLLPRHGTTAFLPTTVSAPAAILAAVLEQLAGLLTSPFHGARPLGVHLEGPFLNPAKRGTHREGNLLRPDVELVADWISRSRGLVRLLTMAPELEGAGAVARLAREAGIVVGMGHSDASLAEARSAADDGTRYAVHTFNAMRSLRHRDPGIAGAVLADDRVFAEVIADGVHVSPEVVKILLRAKGPRRIILATDATSASGMADGSYPLGAGTVRVEGGVCRDFQGRLAGSTLTQDAALRNLMKWSGDGLQDALFGVTLNPALALGLDGRGRLEPGAQADFVLLDKTVRVLRTVIEGKTVFQSRE